MTSAARVLPGRHEEVKMTS